MSNIKKSIKESLIVDTQNRVMNGIMNRFGTFSVNFDVEIAQTN